MGDNGEMSLVRSANKKGETNVSPFFAISHRLIASSPHRPSRTSPNVHNTYNSNSYSLRS
jgi:hypothetical protein